MIVSSTSRGNNRTRTGVDKSLHGSDLNRCLEQIPIAINIDIEVVHHMLVINICMGRRRVEDHLGPDLLNNMTNVVRLGYVTDVVADPVKTVGEGWAGHDCNGCDGGFIEEELDDMLTEKATAAYDQASTKMGFLRRHIHDIFLILAFGCECDVIVVHDWRGGEVYEPYFEEEEWYW